MGNPQLENRRVVDGRNVGVNYRIPVSNGIFEHREKVGSAIWLFLLLVDWTTVEQDGLGQVLGGKPVTAKKLKEALRLEERQVRAQLQRLQSIKFIRLKRTSYGFVIEVLKSKKFFFRDRQKVAALPLPDRQETSDQNPQIGNNSPLRSAINCRNKEDYTEETKKERVRVKPSLSNGSDPRVKEFFTWWDSEYQKQFLAPYVFNGGKDGATIKRLLRSYDLPRLTDLAVHFLESKDPWVQQNGGFTIGVFASQINKLVSTSKATQTRLQPKELPL